MLDDDGQELRDLTRTPLAGFRLAALTKITVQSWQATCNAAEDLSPTRLFAATSQVTREGPRLQRLVLRDNELHTPAKWNAFAPLFKPEHLARPYANYQRNHKFHGPNPATLSREWSPQGSPPCTSGHQ